MRLFLLILALAAASPKLYAEYEPVTQIAIGGEGGWDILSVDSPARRLYLSHATKVVVVDLEKNSVVGEIADTPGVHAFIVAPDLQRGFSSNGKENKVSVVDLKTLTTTAKVDTGEGPDAMVYDPKRNEVYVFNHKGNSATVIDPKTTKVIATIPLAGSPEFGVADAAAGRVYVNIEDKSEVDVIDTTKHEVVAHWPIAPGEEPTGIALDATHHRLFVACNNKLMMMMDTSSGKTVGSVPIGTRVDGCAFDDQTQLAFASCGEGVVTVAKENAPDNLSVAQTLKTEAGARTIAIDPQTHRIYLPTAEFQPAPLATPKPGEGGASSLGAKPARPVIVPGTIKLLVFGPAGKTPK